MEHGNASKRWLALFERCQRRSAANGAQINDIISPLFIKFAINNGLICE